MKKSLSILLVALAALLGFNASAGTTNLKLTDGSQAVLMEHDGTSWTVFQQLFAGDNVVELTNYQIYKLIPAPGIENIKVEPEDDKVFKNADGSYSVQGSNYMKAEYAVTTWGGQAQGPTTTINVAAGSSARVMELIEQTGEYILHKALSEGANTVEFATITDAGTVPFYYLCGTEGLDIDTCTDGVGKTLSLGQSGVIGKYVEINPFDVLSEYNVTTKAKEIPDGPASFVLTPGSSAYYMFSNSSAQLKLSVGDNYATFDASDVMRIYPGQGHLFVSVTDCDGTPLAVNKNGYVEVSGSNFRAPYTITTKVNTMPDPTFTVDVDVPAKVRLCFFPSYKQVTLQSGINTISFSAAGEKTISIETTDSNNFYLVTVNGEKQTASSSVWVDVADGMEIVVRYNFPDEDYTYTFDYADTAAGFFTDVQIDGVSVPVTNNSFKAAAGKRVALYNANFDTWKVNSITMPDGSNATMKSAQSPIEFVATADGSIKVDARKAVNLNVTINVVAGAENIRVTSGSYAYPFDIEGLHNGANAVVIPDNRNTVMVRALDATVKPVTSVSYRKGAGKELVQAEYNANFAYYTCADLEEGAEINIIADKVSYTSTATVYVDYVRDGADVSLTSADGRRIALSAGYNTVTFNAAENGATGFALAQGGASTVVAYCNNEPIANPAAGINLAEGNLYKIYIRNNAPEFSTVTFDVQQSYGISADATIDRVNRFTLPADGTVSVLPGTELSFAATGTDAVVKINGEVTAPDASGRYTLTLDEPCEIYIGSGINNAIDTIEASDAVAVRYYDLQGRPLARPAGGQLVIRVAGARAEKITM